MSDTRKKNATWTVCHKYGSVSWEGAKLAVLMDIRDELQTLNRVFQCHNFLEIPRILRAIRLNTTKKRKSRK